MDSFKRLLTALTIYRHNFDVLHWNAKGKRFDELHALSEEYAYKCGRIRDEVVETAMQYGEQPMSFVELWQYASDDEYEYTIVGADMMYKGDDGLAVARKLINELIELIEKFLVEPKLSESSRAALDEMVSELRKEANYKLRQKLM